MQRANIQYHDFDLVFERSMSGYDVRVVSSPLGEASHRFSRLSELQEERVRTFRAVVGGHRPGKRRIDSPEMHAAKRLGGDLFELAFSGPVEECYRACMKKVWEESGTGLRVRLHMKGAPELADLPWEYLYDARENQFLSLSVSTPLVRYLEIDRPVQPLVVEPPLRVLVMISNPTDIDDLDVEDEWRQLREAVSDLSDRGLVTFDRLDTATLEALQRQLRREEYHVFHYIGHAGFDDQSDDGVLILENERGHSRRVNAERLGNILHDEESLRLAILNACEGARSSRKDPFSGLAQSLVQKGVPAVIAMQFEISDEAAITLSHEFYRALGEGYPADAALGESRKMVSNRNELEWGTPVLFMRSPDGVLFDVAAVNETSRRRAQVHRLVGAAEDAAAEGRWEDALQSAQAALAVDAGSVAAAAIQGRAKEAIRAAADRDAERERTRKAEADARQDADAKRTEQERLAAEQKRREEDAQAKRDEERLAEQRRLDEERRAREQLDEERRQREERILAGLEAAAGVRPKKRSFLKRAAFAVLGVFGAGVLYAVSQQASNEPFVESDFLPVPVGEQVSPPQTEPQATAPAEDMRSVVSPPPAPVAPPPSAAEAAQRIRDRYAAEIREVVSLAGEVESEAMRRLDATLLGEAYAGDALGLLVAHMTTLTSNGIHQDATLLDRSIHSIDVLDDQTASVQMTEVWSTEFHQNGTDICLGRIPRSSVAQTLHLRRVANRWWIYSVDAPAQDLEPEPCFGPVPQDP